MSAVCTRLIAFAGATVRDPLSVDDPQVALVQGRVGVLLDPTRTELGPAPLAAVPDFWDVLVYPRFDKEGYVVLYEAELQDDGSIIVKRDLFGHDDFGHTWAGWPIPGDEVTGPEGGTGVMPTTLLTKAEQKALTYVKKRKEKK
jgi:hypothetical protein